MLNTRMLSQQLASPQFDDPVNIVEWMGALQAQEIRMVKWAVGIRMQNPSLAKVKEALDSGAIIRSHILRPTWHVVPARDFRWMAALNESKLVTGIRSWAKSGGIMPEDFMPIVGKVEEFLEGRHLTKQEIAAELSLKGINSDERMVSLYLSIAEGEGRICSGAEKEGKNTYALTCERIPHCFSLGREEALAELTKRYFRSHGPATLGDFVWWSGLGITDARRGVASLGQDIIREKCGDRELLTHCDSPGLSGMVADKIVHFLPPYDEYLISYTDRSDCIRESHVRFAHNNYGIFQPVILHNGRITGNWRRTGRKTGAPFTTEFFEGCRPAAKPLISRAAKRFAKFLAG